MAVVLFPVFDAQAGSPRAYFPHGILATTSQGALVFRSITKAYSEARKRHKHARGKENSFHMEKSYTCVECIDVRKSMHRHMDSVRVATGGDWRYTSLG